MKRNSDLDFTKIIKLISSFVAQATCMGCCKFFELPKTSECGHTACHTCWQNRRSCKWCAALIDHRTLKQNVPVQNLTTHVRNMCEVFERTFDFKVDTFSIGHMKSLQKHVSALDESMYEITIVNHIKSTAQVHSKPCTKEIISSPNVVVKQVSQVDWETIEQVPEICQIQEIDKQNLEYDPEATKAVKRCLRRSRRLFSISLSAESVEVTSSAVQSPVQINHDTVKTVSPFTHVVSNQLVKGNRDEIEIFSDIDELNVEQILKSATDHRKNVTDWLDNSDSYLKAAICSGLQDVKTVTSTVQIHCDTTTKKILRSQEVVNKNVAQDDWDKIKNLPDVDEYSKEHINCESDSTRNITNSEKDSTLPVCSQLIQNIPHKIFKEITQDDWDTIEQLSDNDNFNNKQSKSIVDTNEYSTENPRRSSRKREFKYYAECHYYPLNLKRRRS